jgi:hypothetical protein
MHVSGEGRCSAPSCSTLAPTHTEAGHIWCTQYVTPVYVTPVYVTPVLPSMLHQMFHGCTTWVSQARITAGITD